LKNKTIGEKMKMNLKRLAIVCYLFGATFQLHSQGYIVPNGVFVTSPPEISVVHNPNAGYYTGFGFNPVSANTFQYFFVLDIGVRVFFVSPNDPITASTILSGDYAELTYPNNYVFNSGTPFYVGLYTGNMTYAPPNGIYTDPLFAWAELENVGGAIELLNSAEEYQGGGIYAGTQTIIPTPEPSELALGALGALLLGFRRWRK
jgi:predicted outer membrane repeat protein